jgi:hypothetical protein
VSCCCSCCTMPWQHESWLLREVVCCWCLARPAAMCADTERRSAARSDRLLPLPLPRVWPLRQLSARSRQGRQGLRGGGECSSTYTAAWSTVRMPHPQQMTVHCNKIADDSR